MPKSHIDPLRVRKLVDDYTDRWESRSWSATDLPWNAIDTTRLTAAQSSAVRFVTLIEDHVPGYLGDLLARFPVDGSVSPEVYRHNREAFRFFVRWARDEDKHANVFSRYQVAAGIQTQAELDAELTREGRKTWRFPLGAPVQIFTYTVIQEKATQLYYQMLGAAVDEPLLKATLNLVQKDEARHFAFYARMLETYVDELGEESLPAIREALDRFKMPLAEQLENYWRWSLEISDTAGGYDYTVAFEELVRILQRANDKATSEALARRLREVRAV
jgi:acyl-[acyl-carrier-protein] desaturase